MEGALCALPIGRDSNRAVRITGRAIPNCLLDLALFDWSVRETPWSKPPPVVQIAPLGQGGGVWFWGCGTGDQRAPGAREVVCMREIGPFDKLVL